MGPDIKKLNKWFFYMYPQLSAFNGWKESGFSDVIPPIKDSDLKGIIRWVKAPDVFILPNEIHPGHFGHLGLDFSSYKTRQGTFNGLPNMLPIRTVAPGIVVDVRVSRFYNDDFFNTEIVIAHGWDNKNLKLYLSSYAHLEPTIPPGTIVDQGQIIGRINIVGYERGYKAVWGDDFEYREPHLHFSLESWDSPAREPITELLDDEGCINTLHYDPAPHVAPWAM